MSIIQAIIIGLISGITSFLPVSSSGHIVLLSKFAGINDNVSLKFLILVQIGVLAAVVSACYPDIVRLLYACYGMIRDLLYNAKIYLKNIRHPEQGEYRPVITTIYRKMAVMLTITTIVTALLALIVRRMAETAVNNLLLTAMGFFAGSLVLLISSYTEAVQRKPSKTRYRDAVLIGVLQGFSAVPGVSRVAMVFSGAGFSGFSRKFKIEYALMTLLPSVIGGLILEGNQTGVQVLTSIGIGPILTGIVIAGISGHFMIRFMKRHLIRRKNSSLVYAIYGTVIGVLCILAYFA